MSTMTKPCGTCGGFKTVAMGLDIGWPCPECHMVGAIEVGVCSARDFLDEGGEPCLHPLPCPFHSAVAPTRPT